MSGFSSRLIELIGKLVQGLIGPVDLHFDLAFLGAQHDRLRAQPTDHVERTVGHTPQRQLLHVLGNAALNDRA
jgi:hypothetical protein